MGQQETIVTALAALAFGYGCRAQEETIALAGQQAVPLVANSLFFVSGLQAPDAVALPTTLMRALEALRNPSAAEARRALARLALKLGSFEGADAFLPALLCMPGQQWIDATADPKFTFGRGTVDYDASPGFNTALLLVHKLGAAGLDPLLERMQVATGLELRMACELIRSSGVVFTRDRPELPAQLIECLDRAAFVKADIDWIGQALAGCGTAGAEALENAKRDSRQPVRMSAQRIARVLFSRLKADTRPSHAGQLRPIDVGKRNDDGDAGVLACC